MLVHVAIARGIATMSAVDTFETEAQDLDDKISSAVADQHHTWYAEIGPALHRFVKRYFNANDCTRLELPLRARFAERLDGSHKKLLDSAWRAESIRQLHIKEDNLSAEQQMMVPFSTYYQLNRSGEGCRMNTVNLPLFYELVR